MIINDRVNQVLMSNQEDEANLSYGELLTKYKKELEYNEERKKDVILKLAKKLVESGAVKHHISGIIANDLKGYVTSDYIRQVLPNEYKNNAKKRIKFAEVTPQNPEPKKKIMVNVDGTEIDDYESSKDWLPDDSNIIMRNNKLNLKLDKKNKIIDTLGTEIKALKELIKSEKDKAKAKSDAEIINSPLYQELQSKFTELEQAWTKHIQDNPKETFKPATEMQPTQTEAIIATDQEIEVDWLTLRTIIQKAASATNKVVYLTIKDGKLVNWESDRMRQQRLREEKGLPITK